MARTPAVKARIRNRWSWNMGLSTRSSINTKTTKMARPPITVPSTKGLVQPMVWPP
jgi:hypothetical protein